MASEKLTSAQSQLRVFGVSGRPKRTGIQDLAESINGVFDLGIAIAEQKQAEEIASAEERLNDVGIQDSEILEIADGAFFAGTKKRAWNVAGERQARKRRAELEDAIREAPDALSAHDIVGQFRREDQASTTNPHIRAGIGDGYTDYAPRLLEDAAQRRIKNSARQEAVDKAETFRDDWNLDPDVIPTRIAVGHQREIDTGGDIPLYHKNVAIGGLNHYAEFPKEGDDVIAQFRAYIAGDPLLEASEQKIYSDAIKSIQADQQRKLNARDSQPKGPNVRLTSALKDLEVLRFNQPGFRVSPKQMAEGLEAARTPAEVAQWRSAVKGIDEDSRLPGLASFPEIIQKRSVLEKTLQTSEGVFPLEKGEVLNFFDDIMRNAPDDALDDPKIRAAFAEDAFRSAAQFSANQTQLVKNLDAQLQRDLTAHDATVAAAGRIGPDKAAEFRRQRAQLISDRTPRNMHRRVNTLLLERYREDMNWSFFDQVETTNF